MLRYLRAKDSIDKLYLYQMKENFYDTFLPENYTTFLF